MVVTYQSAHTVSRLLAAVRRCYDEALLDTIIVDNNSTDGTRQLIEAESGWARIVLPDRNNGFARGCNIGLEHVTTPYVAFINPDAILDAQTLRTMLQFMETHPSAGIVGPAIIEGAEDGETQLQVTGKRLTPARMLRAALPLRRAANALYPIIPGSEPKRTEWVCGAVFMARTRLMRHLNGFDPRFFLYWEEMDLCRRAEQAGFEIWALGTAVARHIGGASSTSDNARIGNCIAKHYFQSRYYYMAKHHGRAAAIGAELAEFLLLSIGAIFDLARGRRSRLKPRMQVRLLSEPDPV